VQSVDAAKAVSWAIGHNPGRVATPTQDTQAAQSSQQAGTYFADLRRMVGWVNPTWYEFNGQEDLNSGRDDLKPATLTVQQTPGGGSISWR